MISYPEKSQTSCVKLQIIADIREVTKRKLACIVYGSNRVPVVLLSVLCSRNHKYDRRSFIILRRYILCFDFSRKATVKKLPIS